MVRTAAGRELPRKPKHHRAGKLVYLVALVGGRPIGHLGVILDPEQKSRMGPGELWQLGVHPVLQGHGIGTRLIEAGEHILRGRGIRSASIGVAYDNPGAKRLYERLGYEVVGESVDRWSCTDADGEEVQVVEDGWDLQKDVAYATIWSCRGHRPSSSSPMS